MSTDNTQTKQNRDYVIAVRVTQSERQVIEKQAYLNRKKAPRILLDAFFQQLKQQQDADCNP